MKLQLILSAPPGAHFLGERFWKNHDLGVILMYDANGYISGIQSGVSRAAYIFSHIHNTCIAVKEYIRI